MRGHRRKYRELSAEARAKSLARSYARIALKRGIIVRGPCADCGGDDSQMHHADYSKPTEVTWLCRACHLGRHKDGEHVAPPPFVDDPNFVPRASTGRSKVPPLSTRLSPEEKAAFERKAELAGMTVSAAARAAIEAWDPAPAIAQMYTGSTCAAAHMSTDSRVRELRVEYDE